MIGRRPSPPPRVGPLGGTTGHSAVDPFGWGNPMRASKLRKFATGDRNKAVTELFGIFLIKVGMSAVATLTKPDRLELFPSTDAGLFHIVDAGRFVGSIARDDRNRTSGRPWAWRLVASDGTTLNLTGRCVDLDTALADAEHAYVTHLIQMTKHKKIQKVVDSR